MLSCLFWVRWGGKMKFQKKINCGGWKSSNKCTILLKYYVNLSSKIEKFWWISNNQLSIHFEWKSSCDKLDHLNFLSIPSNRLGTKVWNHTFFSLLNLGLVLTGCETWGGKQFPFLGILFSALGFLQWMLPKKPTTD